MLRLGVIGYGNRISGVIRLLERLDPAARIVAITDVRNEEIKKQMAARTDILDKPVDIAFYTDAEEMLDKEELSGVLVGTRCSLHTTMACKVAKTGLPLYLEKPVATTMADLRKLHAAFKRSKCEVVVSFPLRLTPLVQITREIVDSGRIGSVEQVQAVNNVSYGHGYFSSWYRDFNETGGLWLQKATHDLDYINYILGKKPVLVAALNSQRVFGRRKPAGLTCDVCDEQEECPESVYSEFYLHNTQQVFTFAKKKLCAFGVDTILEDNGSALVEYENGVHAAYTQNFMVRRDAGQRGATVIGYKGSISFDWYTDMLKVVMHHRSRTETINCASKDGHGGGDTELVRDFISVMRGEGKSRAPISAGIMSALMCLKARKSCETRKFQKIDVKELEK